jgi:integrase
MTDSATLEDKRRSTRRRGNGEGSIFQRKSDSRWCATVNVGYDDKGKRRRVAIYGDTKKAVQDELLRLQSRKLSGTLSQVGRQTVGQYLDWWLENSSKPQIRPTSYVNYERMIRLHIKPRIGGVALSKLTPVHVQSLCADMQTKAVERKAARDGASIRRLTFGVLHKALKEALRLGLVARNVCDVVNRPRMPRSEFTTLSLAEARDLLTSATDWPIESIIVLALTTGMRLGEILGLQWEDVDLGAGCLSVRYTLMELNGEYTLAEPKTEKSRRRIELSAIAVESLAKHRQRCMAVGGFVFRMENGEPYNRTQLYREFRPAVSDAGLPRMRFHDLRHTAATLLLAGGEHPKIVQELLGHSAISMTLDTYSHATPTMQRQAVDRLGAMLKSAAS